MDEKLNFLKCLRSHLKNNQYDIIHCHHDYLSGYYLLTTLGIKFRKRILHIHNTDVGLPIRNKIVEAIFLPIFKTTGILLNDIVVVISRHALDSFLTFPFKKIVDSKIIYYIINFDKFYEDEDQIRRFKAAFFEEEKIPPGTKIMLFVGRLCPLKNPLFVIDILKKMIDKGQEVVAVFVGKGDDESKIIAKSDSFGLRKRIRILGWSGDAVKIMQISDVFVFPRVESPKEGLGLVVVEAQCAGLPIVLSKGIDTDAVVIPELVKFVPLNNNPEEWAREAEFFINKEKMHIKNCMQIVKESKFSVEAGVESIIKLYE